MPGRERTYLRGCRHADRFSAVNRQRAPRGARPYETGNTIGNLVWFDHERLDVYRKALDFVRWCVGLGRNGDVARSVEIALDRASTGVVLNIAEGNGKFSAKDRCRFIDHSRTAALQAAAIPRCPRHTAGGIEADYDGGQRAIGGCRCECYGPGGGPNQEE